MRRAFLLLALLGCDRPGPAPVPVADAPRILPPLFEPGDAAGLYLRGDVEAAARRSRCEWDYERPRRHGVAPPHLAKMLETAERLALRGGESDFVLIVKIAADAMADPLLASWLCGTRILSLAARLFREKLASTSDVELVRWIRRHLEPTSLTGLKPVLARERERCLATVDAWTREGVVCWPRLLKADAPDLDDPLVRAMDRELRVRPEESAAWLREHLERLWDGGVVVPTEGSERRRAIEAFGELLVKAWVPYPDLCRREDLRARTHRDLWLLWCRLQVHRYVYGRYPSMLAPGEPYSYEITADGFVISSGDPECVVKTSTARTVPPGRR